jgi:hypothetical protein
MRKVLFLLLFLPGVVFCQHRKLPPAPPAQPPRGKDFDRSGQCLHRDLFSNLQRREFFPFKDTYTVKLISFNDPKSYQNEIPVYDHILDMNKVGEIKTLTINGIDSLTDILFNIGYTPVKPGRPSIYNPGGKCFNPRNAVLFMDKNDRVLEYINICFECHQIEYSSDKIKRTDFCKQKFDLMKSYFLARGIKIGTVLETRQQVN